MPPCPLRFTEIGNERGRVVSNYHKKQKRMRIFSAAIAILLVLALVSSLVFTMFSPF